MNSSTPSKGWQKWDTHFSVNTKVRKIGGIIGAGVGLAFAGASGGLVAKFGAAFIKGGIASLTNKFISDLSAYMMFGKEFDSWDSYATAFIFGVISKGFGLSGFSKFAVDVLVRPVVNQIINISFGRKNSFELDKLAYDIFARGITYGMPGEWKPIARGMFSGYYDWSFKNGNSLFKSKITRYDFV